MTRCALYARVSTQQQAGADRVSIGDQARELLADAKARGWQVAEPPDFPGREKLPAHVFGEPGLSGELLEGRPGLMALLGEVTAGRVDALMVRDTNRLSRRALVMQQIIAVLEAVGCRLVAGGREYDTRSDDDLMVLGIFGSIDQHAKRWLVGNMARARHSMKGQGRFGNPSNPYGFEWSKVDKKPVEVAAEIAVVREIFRLSAEERLSCEQIAGLLRERNVPTRKPGGWWFGSQIAAIIRRPHYKGEWPTGGKDAKGRPVLAKEHPPAVVTPKQWAAAQRVVRHHGNHHGPRLRQDFLLGKLAFCECGSAMTGRQHLGSRQRYRYYRCHARAEAGAKCEGAKYIPAGPLEEAVWSLVERLAADPRLVEKMLAMTDSDLRPVWLRDKARCEKLLRGQEQERTRLLRALRKGQIKAADFDQGMAEIETERADLSEKAEALRAAIDSDTMRREGGDRVRAELEAKAARLDLMDIPERRDLLRRLHLRVIVAPDGEQARVEIAGAAFLGAEGLLPAVSHSEAPS